MASERELIKLNELNLELFEKFTNDNNAIPYSIEYDSKFDALFLYFKQTKKSTVVHYLDDNLGLIYEFKTKEVIGIQFEGFNKSLINKYPELRKAWEMNSKCGTFGDIVQAYTSRKSVVAREIAHVAESVIQA